MPTFSASSGVIDAVRPPADAVGAEILARHDVQKPRRLPDLYLF